MKVLYGDEKIIELLNEYKKSDVGDVYSGIYIKGDFYHFKRYSFYNNNFNIMLPLRFKNMSDEMVKLKYSGQMSPDIIKTNDDANIDLTFTLLDIDLGNMDLLEEVRNQIGIIKKIQPGYLLFEEKLEVIEGQEIAWYDFRSFAIDNQIYNLNFIMSLEGKMLLGKFNCSAIKADVWKRVFFKMIYSINTKRTIESN